MWPPHPSRTSSLVTVVLPTPDGPEKTTNKGVNAPGGVIIAPSDPILYTPGDERFGPLSRSDIFFHSTASSVRAILSRRRGTLRRARFAGIGARGRKMATIHYLVRKMIPCLRWMR